MGQFEEIIKEMKAARKKAKSYEVWWDDKLLGIITIVDYCGLADIIRLQLGGDAEMREVEDDE